MIEVQVGTIHIAEPSASGTQIRQWQRKRPERLRDYKTRLGLFVRNQRMEERIPFARGPRHLHITRAVRSLAHKLSEDNFVAGCQVIVDACVSQQVLLDDEDNLVVSYEQVKCAEGDSWTEIDIYEIKEDGT